MNRFFLTFSFTLSLFFIISSCSSNDAIVDILEIQGATAIAKSGTWRITNYIDSGQNETNDFVNYSFNFDENGILTASNGINNTFTGDWSVTNSSNSIDDLDFNISFFTPPILEDLTDDWDIVSISNTKIDLIDVSGGNGGTDTLTFIKN